MPSTIGECPICCEIRPNTNYIICPEGHTICQPCKTATCPFCRVRYPNPATRNRDVEQAIAERLNPVHSCKFAANGCTFKGAYFDLDKHEASCDSLGINCPVVSCAQTRVFDDLLLHVQREHGDQDHEVAEILPKEALLNDIYEQPDFSSRVLDVIYDIVTWEHPGYSIFIIMTIIFAYITRISIVWDVIIMSCVILFAKNYWYPITQDNILALGQRLKEMWDKSIHIKSGVIIIMIFNAVTVMTARLLLFISIIGLIGPRLIPIVNFFLPKAKRIGTGFTTMITLRRYKIGKFLCYLPMEWTNKKKNVSCKLFLLLFDGLVFYLCPKQVFNNGTASIQVFVHAAAEKAQGYRAKLVISNEEGDSLRWTLPVYSIKASSSNRTNVEQVWMAKSILDKMRCTKGLRIEMCIIKLKGGSGNPH